MALPDLAARHRAKTPAALLSHAHRWPAAWCTSRLRPGQIWAICARERLRSAPAMTRA